MTRPGYVAPRYPRLGARIVRGLRTVGAYASGDVEVARDDDPEMHPNDELDDAARALEWIRKMVAYWEALHPPTTIKLADALDRYQRAEHRRNVEREERKRATREYQAKRRRRFNPRA